MVFTISKERMYHFPHNTLFVDELLLLLKSLDLNRSRYSFKELRNLMFIKEIENNSFSKFHSNKPYRIIVKGEDVDEESIKKKFKEVKKNKSHPQGMPKELYERIISQDIDKVTKYFLEKRRNDFQEALKELKDDPQQVFDVQHKPTKTWKYNWVEFVRDYVDFSAYCGLTPCYYKLPQREDEDGYVITNKLKELLDGKIKIEEVLMDYKYSNSSINIKRYKQFNIKTRPFYSVLKLLSLLEEKKIYKIESHLLFGCISCLSDEKEIKEARDYILNFIKKEYKINRFSNSFLREITRFISGMHRFLIETELVEKITEKGIDYYAITKKGKSLIESTPPNSLFFGEYTERGIYYSPLIAYLLKRFADNIKEGRNSIPINVIIKSLGEVDKEIILSALRDISTLSPNPIKLVKNDIIELNTFDYQYAVSPYVDFSSIEEAEFVYGRGTIKKTRKLEIGKLEMPPEDIINELLKTSSESDGEAYEDSVEKALKLLGLGEVNRMGQKSRFSRVSDILWKLEYESGGEIKTLLIVIEAKAGNAIYSFREDKESEDMINTLLIHKKEFTNLHGIWVIVLDSDKIPDSKHGGFRGDGKIQKSFLDKLMFIHQKILASFGKPVLVTAFAIKPFIEYYKYLYSLIKLHQLENINSFVEEFYMKGKVFFDDYRYIKVLNDAIHLKKSLFI